MVNLDIEDIPFALYGCEHQKQKQKDKVSGAKIEKGNIKIYTDNNLACYSIDT